MQLTSAVLISTIITPMSQAMMFRSGTDPLRLERVLQQGNEDQIANASASLGTVLMDEAATDEDWRTIIQHFNRSSSLGHPAGQYFMALAYQYGLHGVQQSPERALVHFYFAALGGNTNAQIAMGMRHLRGIGVPKTCRTAAMYLELAAASVMQEFKSNAILSLQQPERLSDDVLEELRLKRASHGAVAFYESSARTGDVAAQRLLGGLYYHGLRGLPQDLVEAALLYQEAADNGDGGAMANLGHMFAQGIGVEQDAATAMSWFEEADAAGHPAGTNGMGTLWLQGLGVARSTARAFNAFKRAATAGNVPAMYNLGMMHFRGDMGSKDFAQAIKHLTMAAQKGEPRAMYALAKMALHGVGQPPSCSTATAQFEAFLNKVRVSKQLDRAYEHVSEGRLEAALWQYLVAAEMGHEMAQWNAAWLLDDGWARAGYVAAPRARANTLLGLLPDLKGWLGMFGLSLGSKPALVAQNNDTDPDQLAKARIALDSAALQLYQMAADQGNAPSLLRIGDFHYFGYGMEEPALADAAASYRMAAAMQNPQAMFNMAYMFEMGIGVSKDYHLAKRYYDMAVSVSKKALVPGKIALARLTGRMLLEDLWARWNAGSDDDAEGTDGSQSTGKPGRGSERSAGSTASSSDPRAEPRSGAGPETTPLDESGRVQRSFERDAKGRSRQRLHRVTRQQGAWVLLDPDMWRRRARQAFEMADVLIELVWGAISGSGVYDHEEAGRGGGEKGGWFNAVDDDENDGSGNSQAASTDAPSHDSSPQADKRAEEGSAIGQGGTSSSAANAQASPTTGKGNTGGRVRKQEPDNGMLIAFASVVIVFLLMLGQFVNADRARRRR